MHFLITAGPTREPIDPVRYLSNRSSGKMGYALAAAASDAGHEVTLISGPVAIPVPTGVTVDQVETLTGYDFFSNLNPRLQARMESKPDTQ